jgi:hypothetical protein
MFNRIIEPVPIIRAVTIGQLGAILIPIREKQGQKTNGQAGKNHEYSPTASIYNCGFFIAVWQHNHACKCR